MQQATLHRSRRVRRARAAISYAIEALEIRLLLAGGADLTPYQPAGWAGKIVLSTLPNTNTDATTITTADTLYVDTAFINQGDQPVTSRFFTQIFLDGVKVFYYYTDPPLNAQFYYNYQDAPLTGLTPGKHTISFTADYGNSVAESDESNNSFSRTFNVVRPNAPDLVPFQLDGWSDRIVISTTPGANTDASLITTNDSLYFDFAEFNQGPQTITAQNSMRLLLDGQQFFTYFITPPVPAGSWGFALDAPHAPLSAGPHTVTLEVDYLHQVAEGDESNNTYSRSFMVQAPTQLPVITALAAAPAPVTLGNTVTLSATGVSDPDGSVASVSFYRESNGVAGLQPYAGDTLIDTDTSAAGGWTAVASTTGLASGTYTYYSTAQDNLGATSTPVSTANAILSAPTGSIGGVAFQDLNADGIRSANEPLLPDWTLFLDTNNNNALDPGEMSVLSDSQGHYTFGNLPAGRYTVAQLPPAGWSRTTPSAPPPSVWVELGPTPMLSTTNGNIPDNGLVSGRVTAIAPHPTDPSTYYIGGANGGVWKTTNAGASWVPLTDGQASLAIGALAIAPSNPNIIYAGTGDGVDFSGRGILKSIDAGQTWTLLGSDIFTRRAFSRIIIDPANPNIVYAAVHEANDDLPGNRGLWKSNDGGATWNDIFTYLADDDSVSDLVMDPTDSQIIYCAIGNPEGSDYNGVFKSIDGGADWFYLDNVPFGRVAGRIRLAIASDGQTLYASIVSPITSGLLGFFQSTDGGNQWIDRTASTPNYLRNAGSFTSIIAVDPNNPQRIYAAGAGNFGNPVVADAILRSDDGGATWKNIGEQPAGDWPHIDNHALAFDAAGRLLDGNDGGIWKTADYGASWIDLNANLSLTEFVHITTDGVHRNLVYGGSQDNGTSMFTGAPIWNQVAAGDGGVVRVDPANTNTVYHTFFYAPGQTSFFRRSDDAGATWLVKTAGINTATGGGLSYPPFILDPSNPSRLFLGLDRLYESIDRADSWTPISPVLVPNTGITAVTVSPNSPGIIYIAYDDDSIWRTTDGGANWNNVSSGLPAVPLPGPPPDDDDDDDDDTGSNDPDAGGPGNGDLQIDPSDDQTVYFTRPDYGGSHVFRTNNGGNSWSDISGDLGDLPVNAIAIDPRTSILTLYIGTLAGVYVSSDSGTHWTRFGSGLPFTDVTDLELSTTGNFITASTFGRGAWQIALTAASVGAIGVTLAAGQNVQLADFGAQHYPTVTGAIFDFSTSSHRLLITFSKAMSAALSLDGFVVRAMDSGLSIPPAAFTYDPAALTATLAFAAPLPDGRYRLTIAGGTVADEEANALDGNADGNPGDDFTFDFFFLAGDANHDGSVGFADLVAVAQNYGGSGKSYAQGDLNYDGNVGFTDLVMVAQRYGTSLAPLPAAEAMAPVIAAIAVSTAKEPAVSRTSPGKGKITSPIKSGEAAPIPFSITPIPSKAAPQRRRRWEFD